ncbi:hypothetical protein AWZ03_013592 [Drosophila navojoa]|uniref:Fatty acyl-CoA reductase n=1 Tax=Drosophila navojoa TaxID=7232 RepID=A0A484ATG5_DRONA|nr:hypothetical protein AWZ03_013592 [Drosophila navojoa]
MANTAAQPKRMIIEKLLRETEVKRIYALIRPKRGKNIQERIAEWKTVPLFEVLLKAKPDALDRVIGINGDCAEPDLGIRAVDRKLLLQQVELVVHSAATVSFVEPLHVALDINTRATRCMLQLAKQMPRLVAFVHISTAYSNCVIHHITDRFYPEHLSCNVSQVLQLRETLSTDLFDRMAPTLLDRFPNTYTYTKALAEQLIATEAGDLPVCVFRPAAIVASHKEPVTGWIDNLYGPIALLYGVAIGVLRVAPVNKQAPSNFVPVDGCSNLALAAAWKTAEDAEQRRKNSAVPATPTIYNYVPTGENSIRHEYFMRAAENERTDCLLPQCIWYPFLHTTKIVWLYKLATIFYHLIPGYLIDLALRVRGQKPRMIRIYDKIHKNIDVLQSFLLESWTFETPNVDRLWQCMSPVDQQLFDFNLNSLNWEKYLQQAFFGMCIYLSAVPITEKTLKRSLQKMKR